MTNSTNTSPSNPTINHQNFILKYAISSRFLLLTLIIFWQILVHPYDTSSPLNPNCLSSYFLPHPQPHQNVLWPQLGSTIEDSIVWDSVYFVRIAECGYEYEQSYAFWPLLPICIFIFSHTVFAPLVPLIGLRAVLALAGYVVNNIAFVLAAFYFYRLSVVILKDKEAALKASIFFCFNPASIFYSSIYSESLYSLFSLGGLYHLISGADNIAVLWFALSGCARSNGVLNAGYFCFRTLHQVYRDIFLEKHIFLAVKDSIIGAVRCVCIFLPFIVFQAYGYHNMCRGYLPDEMRPWCKFKIPLLYNYIQSYYWGVGFLRYFQLKQLPNFLLASPILSLAFFSILHYVRSYPEIFFSLGFRSPDGVTAPVCSQDTTPMLNIEKSNEKLSTRIQESDNLRHRKQSSKGDNHPILSEHNILQNPGCFHAFVIPCTVHLGFMATTAFLVMHVQVSTRFLSANPPLYWFASHITMFGGFGKKWGYMIWAYSIAYILLGSLLFSNFYPFT